MFSFKIKVRPATLLKKRLQELNVLKKVTIYLHKNIRKVRLERKINQEKQRNKQTATTTTTATTVTTKAKKAKKKQKQKQKKCDTLPTKLIFPKDFLQVVSLLLFQKSVY